MYHLIVGAIAVAVFTALSLLVWLGGHQFTDAQLRAAFVSAQQQEQQIGAALTLYRQEYFRPSIGENTALLDGLHGAGYLTEIPPGTWFISSDGKRVGKPLDGQTPASCARMNKLAGFDAVCPPCDSEADKATPICQQPL